MNMSVRLMRLKELCDLWFAGATHRDCEGEIGELAIFGFNRNAIDVKKDQCCCSTSPFVPLNEWMVHHYVEQVRGSHLKGKRVKINTIEACSRLLEVARLPTPKGSHRESHSRRRKARFDSRESALRR